MFLYFIICLFSFIKFEKEKLVVLKNGNYTVTQMPDNSSAYNNASLKLLSPMTENFSKADTVNFSFAVQNFELGMQTPDASEKRCANSAKGQHIHFILDNKPYEALYKSNFKTYLPEGKHLLMAFISRSYHQSIKQPNAFVLKQITVGESKLPDYDLTKPMLFYSRPKGIYIGADTANIMVDFFVANCTLSPKSYKVRLSVNGVKFMLSEWKPYSIKGLPMGENIIKLELVDKNGKPVPGPFNSTERKISLAASEPIKN